MDLPQLTVTQEMVRLATFIASSGGGRSGGFGAITANINAFKAECRKANIGLDIDTANSPGQRAAAQLLSELGSASAKMVGV